MIYVSENFSANTKSQKKTNDGVNKTITASAISQLAENIKSCSSPMPKQPELAIVDLFIGEMGFLLRKIPEKERRRLQREIRNLIENEVEKYEI